MALKTDYKADVFEGKLKVSDNPGWGRKIRNTGRDRI